MKVLKKILFTVFFICCLFGLYIYMLKYVFAKTNPGWIIEKSPFIEIVFDTQLQLMRDNNYFTCMHSFEERIYKNRDNDRLALFLIDRADTTDILSRRVVAEDLNRLCRFPIDKSMLCKIICVMREFLQDEDVQVHDCAAMALSELRDGRSLEKILNKPGNAPNELLIWMTNISKFGDQRVFATLEKYRTNPDPKIQDYAQKCIKFAIADAEQNRCRVKAIQEICK